MRIYHSLLCLALSLFTLHAAQACEVKGEKDSMPVYDNCPEPVSTVLDRAIKCHYFGGELSGDGTDNDQRIDSQMRKLHCDAIDSDLIHLSDSNKNDEGISKAIAYVKKQYDLE